MRITKHTITRMQQALVAYGIAVPVTGEFDGVLQQAYIDWASRNEDQTCNLHPITDAQVSAKLLALAPDVKAEEAPTPVEPDTAKADADAALAELEAKALREAEEAKVAAKEAASIAKWAGKADAKAEAEQAQADAAQAELAAAKSHKKAK